MTLDKARARQLLTEGNLRVLFTEVLGWDRYSTHLTVVVAGSEVTLQALAQKRGMVAYRCPTPAGQQLPDYAARRKIEHQVTRSAHEHLIVFTDASEATQVWQWVKKDAGKPIACREHTFHRSQPGDALLQKLEGIMVTLAEEERLTLLDMTGRARAAFDVERVTKRFYERFQKEHAAFLKFISGITENTDREWYASVMLNRLMFVYFIQRKGFLDGDHDYLRNRLVRMREEQGKNKFYSFYRYFLLRLFHEGLGGQARPQELEKLVGRVPYLNGGLFDVHELEKPERYGKVIQIPDKAFEKIFDYFDQYQWHLDERPLRADNEINPDVLGYIFEKYVNQKQMGAYYTKEDITEYISKNTVLPFLLDTACGKCKVAFENTSGPTVWDVLKADPDRYIYKAVRDGAAEPLPDAIAVGLNPSTLHDPVGDGPVKTLELRQGWNAQAPETHALPTETWREVIARRTRYEEIKSRLSGGQVREVNDLITYNLDIRQFVQDAIENCEGPELLRAFWHAIEKVTVLDPTCGSGAFLFAALNILEPLYEACLDRMAAFVDDLARSGEKHRPEKYSDFRKILARVGDHTNRRYFIFKSIILNNLYGVDIMEEAVEICKLRLFLKLAAQVEPDTARKNLGIDPLPDIDFNIRAGNTLVGYATLEAARQAIGSTLDFDNVADKIAVKAADLQQAFDAFRARQIEGDGSVPGEDKQELRRRLKALGDELNLYLAAQYGVLQSTKGALDEWLRTHQPFHWFVEFFAIMNAGGFDVIIGNPPYVEYDRRLQAQYTVRGYLTFDCGNLHAFMAERCLHLARGAGRIGLIVPLPSVNTARMRALQSLVKPSQDQSSRALWVSSYDERPSSLFSGVDQRLAIEVFGPIAVAASLATTGINRWASSNRERLFPTIHYTVQSSEDRAATLSILNLRMTSVEDGILKAFYSANQPIALYRSDRQSREMIAYRTAGGRYWKIVLDHPFESESLSNKCAFLSGITGRQGAALLMSSMFWWYYSSHFDMYNLKDYMIFGFRFSSPSNMTLTLLERLGKVLQKSLDANAVNQTISSRTRGTVTSRLYVASHSKAILDDIDHVLAQHYRLTEEELDFVVNYDVKYRMGVATEDV